MSAFGNPDDSASGVIPELKFDQADPVSVLRIISSYSGIEIIPAGNLNKKITIHLKDCTWRAVLDSVCAITNSKQVREKNYIYLIPENVKRQHDNTRKLHPGSICEPACPERHTAEISNVELKISEDDEDVKSEMSKVESQKSAGDEKINGQKINEKKEKVEDKTTGADSGIAGEVALPGQTDSVITEPETTDTRIRWEYRARYTEDAILKTIGEKVMSPQGELRIGEDGNLVVVDDSSVVDSLQKLFPAEDINRRRMRIHACVYEVVDIPFANDGEVWTGLKKTGGDAQGNFTELIDKQEDEAKIQTPGFITENSNYKLLKNILRNKGRRLSEIKTTVVSQKGSEIFLGQKVPVTVKNAGKERAIVMLDIGVFLDMHVVIDRSGKQEIKLKVKKETSRIDPEIGIVKNERQYTFGFAYSGEGVIIIKGIFPGIHKEEKRGIFSIFKKNKHVSKKPEAIIYIRFEDVKNPV